MNDIKEMFKMQFYAWVDFLIDLWAYGWRGKVT